MPIAASAQTLSPSTALPVTIPAKEKKASLDGSVTPSLVDAMYPGMPTSTSSLLTMGRSNKSIQRLARAAAESGKRLMIEIRDIQPVRVSFE